MFRYAEELWSQLLAAQLIQEPHCFVAWGAVRQPLQTILVASADLIGGKRGDFKPWGRRTLRGGLARSFLVQRSEIRGLGSLGRGRLLARNQFVEFNARKLRMGAVRMSSQEQEPSFGRLFPVGNSIVQVLVDIRRGDRINRGNIHFPLCGSEGPVDDDADIIKPLKRRGVFEAVRRIGKYHRDRKRQNERVFPNSAHATHSTSGGPVALGRPSSECALSQAGRMLLAAGFVEAARYDVWFV
jgi:hypothetical protein